LNPVVLFFIALLWGCGSAPIAPVIEREASSARPRPPVVTPTSPSSASSAAANAPGRTNRGAYYKDDGPGDAPPPDIDRIVDAQPRVEPLHRFANNPYNVFGQDYVPMRALVPFRQSGYASWYGRKFHGQKTSSGEIYDMYGMTAAHPTLPIPSYVRVTSLHNGRQVVVRINDRGPFHAGRVIDLSFSAAFKLGYVIAGSTLVQVELLPPDEIERMQLSRASTGAAQAQVREKPPVQASPAIEEVRTQRVAAAPSATSGNVYLQLGAFSARSNAESFRDRVYRDVAWLSDSIEIFLRDGIYRLHLGPYRDRDQAAGMVERLRRDIELKPVYVTR